MDKIYRTADMLAKGWKPWGNVKALAYQDRARGLGAYGFSLSACTPTSPFYNPENPAYEMGGNYRVIHAADPDAPAYCRAAGGGVAWWCEDTPWLVVKPSGHHESSHATREEAERHIHRIHSDRLTPLEYTEPSSAWAMALKD